MTEEDVREALRDPNTLSFEAFAQMVSDAGGGLKEFAQWMRGGCNDRPPVGASSAVCVLALAELADHMGRPLPGPIMETIVMMASVSVRDARRDYDEATARAAAKSDAK